jgi:hypothetical protein
MKGKFSTSVIASGATALGIVAASSTVRAEDTGKATSSELDASRFTCTRLYCTPDNESHFAELTADLASQNFAPPAFHLTLEGTGKLQPCSSEVSGRTGAPPT